MTTVILVIHVLIALALIGVVLLQRSEGGALGIGGGGGGGGGVLSGRGAANLLTRITAILAASFMATSMILAILNRDSGPRSVLETISVEQSSPAETLRPDVRAVPAADEASAEPAVPQGE
jgi:preprotein translocase subunit SecG